MDRMTNEEKWLDFVNLAILRPTLTYVSVFIALYESTTQYIEETVRDFFSNGITESGPIVHPDYKKAVLDLHKSKLAAFMLWLKANGCIDDEDIKTLNELRVFRNHVVHKLMEILFDGFPSNLPKNFSTLIDLRVKIEKWFIQNIEIPTNLEFDDKPAPGDDEIITSTQITLKIILDMLDENEETAKTYYNELLKMKEARKSGK